MDTIKATYKDLTITMKLSDSKEARWTPSGHHYRVTVTRQGQRAAFDFWGSLHDMQTDADPDPMDALRSWLDDAIMGSYDIDEFAAETGFDATEKPSELLRTYKACRRATAQVERLGIDAYDYINDLDN